MLIVLLVAALVVVAALWYVYLRPSQNNGPEGTVRDMIDAMNRKDATDYVGQTTIMLGNPTLIETEISDYEQMWTEDSYPQLKIISLEVTYGDQMTPEVSREFSNISSAIESGYHVDVQDFCGVHFRITAASGGGPILEDDLPLFKVNSVWYIEPYMDPWAP